MSFSQPFITHRTRKDKFYTQVNRLINWHKVDKQVKRYYKANHGEVGRDGYEGLLLFKMLLLGIWNNLSDYGVEELVNDSLSASSFCGLSLEDDVPDHSILSRFRTTMTKRGVFDKLLSKINQQLEANNVMVKTVTKVDASITDTPRKPRGNKTFEVDDDNQAKQCYKPSVDQDASWVKKAGKTRYGFKKHIITDDEGLVIGVKTTKASVHDSQVFEELVGDANLPPSCEVQADKAYKSKRHDNYLNKHKLKNGTQHRAYRNKPLTKQQTQHNKQVAKTRYMVERTFGSMVRWFGAGTARYVGIDKMHTQHVLESIAYNLKRMPNLMAKQIVKQGVYT